MKKDVVAIVLAVIFSLSYSSTGAQIDMGLNGSIGIPSGYMDFSINCTFYARTNLLIPINPEIMVAESFSTKGDGGDGQISTNVLSGYLFGRHKIKSPIRNLLPYIAPGVGIHYIFSYSNSKSALGKQNKTTLVSKVHLFLGTEYTLSSKWFLFGSGRVTYPSDIIIDSGYLGLGIRL